MTVTKPELCITCHVGIEDISPSHPAQAFGCAVCHGGEPLALDQDRAHSTMRGGRNPSDLSVAAQSCGQPNCHGGYAGEEQNHVDRVLKSVQATYAGGIAHVRYSFGAQTSPLAQFGIRAVSDPIKTLPSEALASLLVERRQGPGSRLGQCSLAFLGLPIGIRVDVIIADVGIKSSQTEVRLSQELCRSLSLKD